jgi:hypothetical protein
MNLKQTDWFSILQGFGSKSMDEIGVIPFLGTMLISLSSAFFISFLYVRFYQSRSTGSHIHRAFPLLGMSITAIFISIQFSLPLSLGLLGALSIVRFRTPIKEPEEIGFIMLVVATSLCCATFNMLFLFIILIVAVVALLCLRFGGSFFTVYQNDGVIVIDVQTRLFNEKNVEIMEALSENIAKGRLESITDNAGTTIFSYNFQNQQEKSLLRLKNNLSAIHPDIALSIFYNNNQVL